MAEISFELTGVDDSTVTVSETLSFELRRDIDAPCDSLSLTFISERSIGEIKDVKAYCDGKLIFFGICDTQRDERLGTEHKIFIYARSAAALLIDNEAVLGSFESPTAGTMFLLNAKEYGFSFELDDIACEGKYIVEKGSSRYAAMNRIVFSKTGTNIVATPDKRLILPKEKKLKTLDGAYLISEKRIINRASLISQIDYKTSADRQYSRHIKSLSAERLGIKRSEKVNLSSLFDWQRDMKLKNILNQSAKDYMSAELTLDGEHEIELYSSVYYDGTQIEDLGDYMVGSACISSYGKIKKTKLKLFKKFEQEELIYVD